MFPFGRRVRLAVVILASAGVGACDKSKPRDAPSTSSSALTASPEPRSSNDHVVASGAPPASSPPAPGMNMPTAEKTKALATGSNAFAFGFWRQTKRDRGNFAFSPASISIAFAMTYGGAKGETASQIRKVFHFEDEPTALMTEWGGLLRSLEGASRAIKLRIANRLFGEKTYPFDGAYLEKTKAAFGAPLEPLDFKDAPEPSRRRINGWVEQQTEDRIKDLLPPDAIKPQTRLVLTNAIYFLGDWEHPFDVKATTDAPFQTSGTTTKRVPTMRQTQHLAVGQLAGTRIIELPYKGGSASLLVVMPEKADGLAALESTLTERSLESWRASLAVENVALSMPRFEVKPASMSLGADLAALGMPIAFDRAKADFTGMGNPPNPDEHLAIDDALHKAFVKVDEKGTEAAAATGVMMAARGGPPDPPREIKVDRPFVFVITDKESGLVLFMGRVTEP